MRSHKHDILILDYAATMRLLSLDVAIEAVEAAYRAHAEGIARLFPVVREPLDGGAVCGIKSGTWPATESLGLKLAGSWPANRSRGLESHQATVLLADAATGQLRALVDGNAVTTQRTAAAGAIGLRTLARKDARIAAILGAGVQATAQAAALRHVLPRVSRIRIWSRSAAASDALAARLREAGTEAVAISDVAAAVQGSDVLITTTPSATPLFDGELVAPGTHINAMGADTRGKRELPPALVARARLVVDDREQARALGESQPPVEWREDPPTIGEVLTGQRAGRMSHDEITIFDSTGLGLQDVATAAALYERARETGEGLWLPWGQII